MPEKPPNSEHIPTLRERAVEMLAKAGVQFFDPDLLPKASVVHEGDVPISEFDEGSINHVKGKKQELDAETDNNWWVSFTEKESGGHYDSLVNVYTEPVEVDASPLQRYDDENSPKSTVVSYRIKGDRTVNDRPIGVVEVIEERQA